jgi:hypothetical protein
MDSVATHELISTLVHTLAEDFAFNANFEDPLLETPAESQGTEQKSQKYEKLIVMGASHSVKLCKELIGSNLLCTELCTPGWLPTDENIAKLESELDKIDTTDCTFVIDLLSNIVFRFEKFDGSLSMPYKSNGSYHMGGKVCVCGREVIVNIIGKLKNIFKKCTGRKIVINPLPRYLFRPCCTAPGHCIGTGTKAHFTQLLEDSLGLKKHLVDGLVKAGVTNVEVINVVPKMVNESSDFNVMAMKLQPLSLYDGVHLTVEGYCKMAEVIVSLICEKDTASLSLAGPAAASRRGFFWRGFTSPVGSGRQKPSSTSYKKARVGGGKWRGPSNQWGARKYGPGRGRGEHAF